MRDVTFKKHGLEVSTSGFSEHGMPEIQVGVKTPFLLSECERFLQFLANYLFDSGKRIKAEETLNYGYWLVKFHAVNNNLLEVWEYNAEGTAFVRGGSLALQYWRDQHQVCDTYGAEFRPPRPDKLTAISTGVIEGLPVQGVRYPWQEHMSGWLLVTDQWNQSIKSLTNHHTHHITANRPDLAKFLALPVGFRFDVNSQKVWLDKEVANQPPI